MAEALRSSFSSSHTLQVFAEREALTKDLPPAGTRQWVPRYKAAVVAAVEAGMLSLEDARRRYLLSEQEFESWRDTIERYGVAGLRMSMIEKRTAPRHRVEERGAAMLNVREWIDCLIIDVSDRGARIDVGTGIRLPNCFELHCKASGPSWWVELIWQRGGDAGVRFGNPLSPPFAIKSGLGDWLIGESDKVAIDRVDSG